jgi:hypothetical protein
MEMITKNRHAIQYYCHICWSFKRNSPRVAQTRLGTLSSDFTPPSRVGPGLEKASCLKTSSPTRTTLWPSASIRRFVVTYAPP